MLMTEKKRQQDRCFRWETNNRQSWFITDSNESVGTLSRSQDKESPLLQTHNSHSVWNTATAVPLRKTSRFVIRLFLPFLQISTHLQKHKVSRHKQRLSCKHKTRHVWGKQMFLYFLDQPVSLKWSSEHVWNSAVILDCESMPRY